MKVFRGLGRQFTEYLSHLAGERACIDYPVLGTLQLRRRNHLHGFGDLLRVLNRLNAPANV